MTTAEVILVLIELQPSLSTLGCLYCHHNCT